MESNLKIKEIELLKLFEEFNINGNIRYSSLPNVSDCIELTLASYFDESIDVCKTYDRHAILGMSNSTFINREAYKYTFPLILVGQNDYEKIYSALYNFFEDLYFQSGGK